MGDRFSAAWLRPVRITQTTVNGDTYTAETTLFDGFARSRTVTRSSSAGLTRTDTTAYYDQLSLWVLGQIASKTNTNTGAIEWNATYFPGLALVDTTYAFGLLQRKHFYHPDGTLWVIQDGLTRSTALTNWKRGIPQLVTYADSQSKSAVVDNAGLVKSITDERLSTTKYGYDTLGRLASIEYPSPDTMGWWPESFARQFVSGELGMPADTWRTIDVKAAHLITTYFDALMRPVLVADGIVGSRTVRYVRRTFDIDGRVTFESYPSNQSSATAGVKSTYDALGRLTLRETTDGITLERTEYLPGNKKRVTDADGKITTITYQAFDQPEYQPPDPYPSPRESDHLDRPGRLGLRKFCSAERRMERWCCDGYPDIRIRQ